MGSMLGDTAVIGWLASLAFPPAQPCWLFGADRAVTSQGISDGEDQYSGQ